MRTWLTLWLCICLLLASPVQGACCLGGAAEGARPAAVADEGDVPPCHRKAAAGEAGTQHDAPAPDSGGKACDHCQCPCRIAAVPLTPPPGGLMATPMFPPVVVAAGIVQRAPIPPLPPPIA